MTAEFATVIFYTRENCIFLVSSTNSEAVVQFPGLLAIERYECCVRKVIRPP